MSTVVIITLTVMIISTIIGVASAVFTAYLLRKFTDLWEIPKTTDISKINSASDET